MAKLGPESLRRITNIEPVPRRSYRALQQNLAVLCSATAPCRVLCLHIEDNECSLIALLGLEIRECTIPKRNLQACRFESGMPGRNGFYFCWSAFPSPGAASAYLGIPPAKLFIGDLTLAAFIFSAPAQTVRSLDQSADQGRSLRPVRLDSADFDLLRDFPGYPRRVAGFSPLTAIRESGLQCLSALPVSRHLGGQRRPELLLQIHPDLRHSVLHLRAGLHVCSCTRLPCHAGLRRSKRFRPGWRWRVSSFCRCFASIPNRAAGGR